MNGTQLRAALRSGQRVYGTCLTSTNAKWPAMLAASGLDFVFIDTEHIPIGREQLAWMCQACMALNLAPVVRVPEPDPYLACVALDGGAAGIIFPYVESVEQVRALHGAIRNRPLKGAVMERALDDPASLSPEVRAYLDRWNEGRVMIVNIESVPAMENLDNIMADPGLDAVLIGPHDLSINLGIPEAYDHPQFEAAILEIITRARAKGLGAGVHFSNGIEPEIRWAQNGANLILHSSDLYLVRDALARDLARFRAELGDPDSGNAAGNTADLVV